MSKSKMGCHLNGLFKPQPEARYHGIGVHQLHQVPMSFSDRLPTAERLEIDQETNLRKE